LLDLTEQFSSFDLTLLSRATNGHFAALYGFETVHFRTELALKWRSEDSIGNLKKKGIAIGGALR
jgi:6-phosphogluconolactonase/glucosamine-6-phosphate isomerase/deaminase